MSQRREVEAKLTLFDELSGILGAMRSFALTELRRVSKRETAQQKVVAALTEALIDVGPHTAAQNHHGLQDIYLLFGSVRGFCGSFNEDVIHCWQTQLHSGPIIAVGERLQQMLPHQQQLICVKGADNGLNAYETVDRILAAITELQKTQHTPFRLWACFRNEQRTHSQLLWPLPVQQATDQHFPPVTHLPLAEIAASIADQYLYHQLLALLLQSIRVENHMRLIQMETALRHLEQGTEEMQRQRNRLRQEEIVEEIELMIASKHKQAVDLTGI
jgi:F-type H+-transporting ATPase subunit gamma